MKAEWRVLRAGALSAVAVRALAMGAGLGVSALLARLISTDVLGGYFLVLSAAGVATSFGLFGSAHSLQRFVGDFAARGDWRAVRIVMRRAWVLVALAGLVVTGGVVALWPVLSDLLDAASIGSLGWAVAGLGVLGGVMQLASVYLRSVRRVGLGVALLGLPLQILFLGGLAALWVWETPVTVDLVLGLRVAAVAAVAAAGIALVASDLRGRPLRDRSETSDAAGAPAFGTLARVSAPMMGHALAAWLLASADLWVLGFFRPGEEVGVYGAMTRLTALVAGVLAVTNATLPPLLSSMFAEDRFEDLERLMQRAAALGGAIAIGLLAVFVVAGVPIVRLVFGADFVPGVTVLWLLALGETVNVASGSPGWLLQMTGHQVVLLRITLATVVLNLVLNVAGVHLAGMYGAAVATASTMIVQNVVMVITARRRVGVRTVPGLDAWTELVEPLGRFARRRR